MMRSGNARLRSTWSSCRSSIRSTRLFISIFHGHLVFTGSINVEITSANILNVR